MSARKESQKPTEYYCLESNEKDGSACQKENKTYPSQSKCQGNHTEDPVNSKETFFGLNSTAIKIISQAVALTQEDKRSFITAIIQALGLNETKGEYLKSIITSYVNYSKPYGAGNVIDTFSASGSSNQPSRKYSNSRVEVCNLLADFQRVNGCANSSGDSVHLLDHPTCAQAGNHNQYFISYEQLLAATDDEGDNDPEYTKPPLHSAYHDLPVSFITCVESRYSRENIRIEAQTKEDYSQNFAKTIKPSIDKLSWREKCEENNVVVEASDEEEDCQALASPDLVYSRDEMDDVADELSLCSLDSDIQHAKQAYDTDENNDQNDEDCDSNSTGDSGSGEAADNDGGVIPPEGNAAPLSLQIPDMAGEGDVVQMESTPHDGKHQLVGADRTIQTTDYTADQSQLVGSQSYLSVQSEAPGTKCYIIVGHGSDIAVTVDGNLENMTVSNLPQDSEHLILQEHPYSKDLPNEEDNYNNEVEQAQELFPLANPTFEPTIPPPKSLDYNNLLYPFQPEDPLVCLSNEVDPPTEAESSTEDTSSEISYVDAVEVNEDSCHHSVSPFVSPAAENVDSQSEEVHMQPPPKYWWRDCRLL